MFLKTLQNPDTAVNTLCKQILQLQDDVFMSSKEHVMVQVEMYI